MIGVGNLMQKAQALQDRMAEIQNELGRLEGEGEAGRRLGRCQA